LRGGEQLSSQSLDSFIKTVTKTIKNKEIDLK